MADRTVATRLRLEVAGFIASAKQAKKAAQDLSHQVADSARKMEKEWTTVGAGLTAVGAGIGLLGAVAAKTSMDFNAEMSSVQAATMATATELKSLRDAALEAGAETAFSASQAAGGIRELAKAGVDMENILGGGLKGALDLAAAGQMEVADAAETAATAMAQFNLAGSDVPHIADLLAAAAGKAQGEVSDMAFALQQSGLVAAQTGLTIEETTAALAAFAERGLLGSDAGTSFKTMLQRLAAPADKAKDLMQDLGIAAYDSQGNFVGLANLAGQLEDALGGLTPAQRQAAQATIFGSDAVRAAAVLYENGADGIREWIDNVDQAGFASDQAAMLLDNLKGDIEALGGSIETAMIATMEQGDGVLRSFVQSLTGAVNVFNDLPPAAQQAIAGVVGVTGVVTGLGGAALIVVPKIVQFRDALKVLGGEGTTIRSALGSTAKFLTGPWGLAIGAATISFLAWSKAHADATRDTAELVATLDEETGAVTDNSRAWTAKKLAEEGIRDEMATIGLSVKTVTDALMGNSQAMDEVNRVLDENGRGAWGISTEASHAADRVRESLGDLDDRIKQGIETRREELIILAESEGRYLDVQHAIDSGLTPATASLVIEQQKAAGAAGDVAGGLSYVEQEAEDAAAAMQKLVTKLDIFIGAPAAMQQALMGWESALDDLAEKIKENGDTLDIGTEKGRENMEAVIDTAEAIKDLAETQIEQGVSTAEVSARMQVNIERLKETMRNAGLAEARIAELIVQYGLVPRDIFTDVWVNIPNLQAALSALNILRTGAGLDPLTGTSNDYTPEVRTDLRRAHSGGMVDSIGTWLPGLAPDERALIGQTGERVLNRYETRFAPSTLSSPTRLDGAALERAVRNLNRTHMTVEPGAISIQTVDVDKAVRTAGRNLDLWADGFF